MFNHVCITSSDTSFILCFLRSWWSPFASSRTWTCASGRTSTRSSSPSWRRTPPCWKSTDAPVTTADYLRTGALCYRLTSPGDRGSWRPGHSKNTRAPDLSIILVTFYGLVRNNCVMLKVCQGSISKQCFYFIWLWLDTRNTAVCVKWNKGVGMLWRHVLHSGGACDITSSLRWNVPPLCDWPLCVEKSCRGSCVPRGIQRMPSHWVNTSA